MSMHRYSPWAALALGAAAATHGFGKDDPLPPAEAQGQISMERFRAFMKFIADQTIIAILAAAAVVSSACSEGNQVPQDSGNGDQPPPLLWSFSPVISAA